MNDIQSIELSELDQADNQNSAILDGNLRIVKDVKVNLEVRVGEAEMTIDELMNLSNESVIQLDKPTSSPVELLLDNKVVAKGFLVASGDNFGIQISSIDE